MWKEGGIKRSGGKGQSVEVREPGGGVRDRGGEGGRREGETERTEAELSHFRAKQIALASE